MCVVSMIHQYHEQFPKEWWTPNKFEQFKDLTQVVEKYDEATGQKECLDPEKAKFLKVIEDYLKEKYGLDLTVAEK
jgi:hypothetical protein